jgi:hypothetical protein
MQIFQDEDNRACGSKRFQSLGEFPMHALPTGSQNFFSERCAIPDGCQRWHLQQARGSMMSENVDNPQSGRPAQIM